MRALPSLLVGFACIGLAGVRVRAQADRGGSADCPCISPWAEETAAPGDSCRELLVNRERDWGTQNHTRLCVERDYGALSCWIWDNHTHNPKCLGPDGRPHDSGTPE